MKREHFGQYLIKYVREASGKTPETLGCSEDEIEGLMKVQGVSQLPKAYREYLEIMGKKGLFHPDPGATWEYEDLLRHKLLFEEEYSDYKHTMPEDIFIIYQALASVFYYFRTGESEQGYPVYSWSEEDNPDGTIGRIKRLADTIEEYFMKRVRGFYLPGKTSDEN